MKRDVEETTFVCVCVCVVVNECMCARAHPSGKGCRQVSCTITLHLITLKQKFSLNLDTAGAHLVAVVLLSSYSIALGSTENMITPSFLHGSWEFELRPSCLCSKCPSLLNHLTISQTHRSLFSALWAR